LVSPATFRVLEYQKGSGPPTVQVETGTSVGGDRMVSITSVGISPSAGERWQIFGSFDGGFVRTSTCAGSTRLAPQDAGFEATAAALPEPSPAGAEGAANDSPDAVNVVALLVASGAGACAAGAVLWGRRRKGDLPT
jgi:hypothetical protein